MKRNDKAGGDFAEEIVAHWELAYKVELSVAASDALKDAIRLKLAHSGESSKIEAAIEKIEALRVRNIGPSQQMNRAFIKKNEVLAILQEGSSKLRGSKPLVGKHGETRLVMPLER